MTSAQEEDAQTASVLIVDDDPWTTSALSLVLSKAPGVGDIAVVHSGAEAIDAYGAMTPDVTLMDLNMPPGMSGIAAIEAIREEDPTARIVVLTTVSPGPGLARALDAGALAVVRKTAPQSELCDVVLSAARGKDPGVMKQLARDLLISGQEMPGGPAAVPQLTPAEREILLLIAQGRGYDDIAERRGITLWTARSHVKRLREKLHAENLSQLVVRALQYRYI